MSRSAAAIQERIEKLERSAEVIRSWQPDLVIGPLQTEEYTVAMYGGDPEGGEPDPEWLAARAARRVVFAEPTRTWQQIMSEGALRWTLGSSALMGRQLEHLIQLSHRPNVRLGIIDQRTPKGFAAPAAFHVIGDTAMVATAVGTTFVTDESDLQLFEAEFAGLDDLAIYDDDAR